MNRFACACLVLFLPAATLPARAHAQRDFSKVEIKTTHVAGNVYMLEGAGGNMAVSAGPDGLLLVDDQFAPLAEKIRAALAALGKGELEFLVNTHWHGDHTGGNPVFGRDALIIAQDNVRKRLAAGSPDRETPPAPPEALPIVTMTDSVSIHFNGEEIKLVHYPPGHTDGDCVVFFPGSGVVHMGDLYYSGRFPYVDLDSGGDVDGYMNDVQRILGRLPEGTRVIPGHGPLSTVEDLREYHRMLRETTRVVRRGAMQQKSLEEITKGGLPEEFNKYSWDFVSADKWIEIVYRNMEMKGLPQSDPNKTGK